MPELFPSRSDVWTTGTCQIGIPGVTAKDGDGEDRRVPLSPKAGSPPFSKRRSTFGIGVSLEETADALGVSVATVIRDWSLAPAWLFRELKQRDR